MITKTVTSGQRSAQATISEETRFVFSDMWNFFHVQNMGAGNVYISMVAGKAGGDDGVITVLPGCSACSSHSFPANSVYITADNATDKVEVVGSNSAISPFKSGKKGGGTNTSDATATAADIVTGKTAYIADGTKATGTAVQGIYPIGTDGRPTGNVTVPSGVTSLYQNIFYQNTAVTSVSLPNTLTSISDNSFYGCTGLTSITCNTAICTFNSTSFNSCTALTTFNTVSNFNPTNLNLSYSTVLTANTMVAMFNNLATIGTTKTITLGATNLAKLSVEQKAIATGKGWTLA